MASYIKQLGLLGLDIFKVKGKGYRLSEPLSLLDQNLIKQSLPDNNPLVFNKLDSTNAWLMRHLHDLQHGQLVLAEYQSLGRGRRGRDWQTPYAGQLCMSLLWHLEDGIEAAMGLSLAVGLAIVEALQECGYQQLGLKWPNDIYQNGKKLGGVLIEIQGHANSKLSLVVGLGINVRVAKLHADKIDQSFSQLETEQSPAADRSALSVAVVRSLNTMFEVFREQGFAGLQQRWNQYDVFFNKPVCLRFSEHKLVSGVAKGVDASGQLLLENDGLVRTYMAGEVSLRGQ
ncbi:bifunctional biotin--[acetyl-CoA-carboxylase] ligase/biotin operon repressor BirA [Agarivorans sp. MS3-6]